MAEKPSGYRLEYASTSRAKCKGPRPCAGSTIDKGELRVGSMVDFRGNTSFAWRHWGCTTEKIISNMKNQFSESSELDGYEDLKPEDKQKVDTAWKSGHVAEEDIPQSARKPIVEGEEEDRVKPKKTTARGAKKASNSEGEAPAEKPKRSRKTKKATEEIEGEDAEDDAQGKPKKTTARKPRAKKAGTEQGDEAQADKEAKPKKRTMARKPREKEMENGQEDKATAPKRSSTKRALASKEKPAARKRIMKKNKDEDDDSGEDFTAAVAAVTDEESDAETGTAVEGDRAILRKKDADESLVLENGEKQEENRKKRKKPSSRSSVSKPSSKRFKSASNIAAKQNPEVIQEEAED